MPLKITWLCVVHLTFIECGACGKCKCELGGGKIEGRLQNWAFFLKRQVGLFEKVMI